MRPMPLVVAQAILAKFADRPQLACDILRQTEWDDLNRCWYFLWAGMYCGVEEDGYIHT